mmetsp:Transcript_41937/g.48628  ORF Transcript_41937/g.48628 Transcript_41937/m.48628 type:complete len:259 (-) Transcript_41937:148-924(-)
METSKSAKFYVIDHQEEFMYEWCAAEYANILGFLQKSDSKLVITNFGVCENYKEPSNSDFNKKMIEQVKTEAEKTDKKNNFVTVTQSLADCIDSANGNLKIGDKTIPAERVCLLDMRGPDVLAPKDKDEFDVFLFGGILGDHPPKDRTSSLRKLGFKIRNLDQKQMPTDTALLATKLIIENNYEFKDLPLIDNYEFVSPEDKTRSVIMEGFRYVSDEINPVTGERDPSKAGNGKPIVSDVVSKRLMFEEFNMDELTPL